MPRKIDPAIPTIKEDVVKAHLEERLPEDSALKESGFKQLSVEALEDLIVKDPGKAQQYLDLFEKLKGYKRESVNREAIIKMSIMTLKQVQQQAEQEYRNQQACERNSHLREDNRTALVGQKDNDHNLILVCQRCQKTYMGVGNEEGALPVHLAGTVDMSLIGGVQ